MVDFGSGFAGAATGAATGSAFGAPGIAAGSVIGGALGLFKKKKKKKKISTFDDRQQRLYDMYDKAIRGEGDLAGLYNWDSEGANRVFDQSVARPAYRNFQENVVPGITGSFRGQNLQNSSYAGEALGRAGRDVQESLDARRSQMQFQGQQQSNQDRMRGVENILNMQTHVNQQRSDPIDDILRAAGPKATEWLFNYIQPQQQQYQQYRAPIAMGA